MKKFYYFSLLSLAFLGLQAQTETLLGSNFKVGGFGGPFFQFSSVDGNFAYYSGGGGGVILDGKFFVGGFGMGLNTQHRYDIPYLGIPTEHELDMGYGGLWLGYIYRPTKVVHLNFSLPIGGGTASFDRIGDGYDADINDAIFVINPNLGMELNLTKWMKFTANAGYMLAMGLDNDYIASDALNSPNLTLGFKFGYFAE